MTSAPDLVHGGWRRRSASIEGGARFETQEVVWIQAGTCYADVRVPFHPAADERCFTGRSGWDGERYRWTHNLDLEGRGSPAVDDVGDLTWERGLLVERGMFPTASGPVAYEEVWERLSGDEGPWVAQEAPDGCLVRVGDHAITVQDGRPEGGFAACYRVLRDARWCPVLVIGDGAALPGPADDVDWPIVHLGRSVVSA